MNKLIANLAANGKPTHLHKTPEGSRLLLLPYGGRVLGLYAPSSDRNFFWTNPRLDDPAQASLVFDSSIWHNTGGLRTWIAPEIDVFFPNYPDCSIHWPPRRLDAAQYEISAQGNAVQMTADMTLYFARARGNVELRITNRFCTAANPLRYEQDMAEHVAPLEYAGFTQKITLESRQQNVPVARIGLWDLIQLPHAGNMLIPTYTKTQPRIIFGNIPPEDLQVSDRLIRFHTRANGEHKIGVRAIAVTGRTGYLYESDGISSLVVRNFHVNPSGEYVDAPWADPVDIGYAVEAVGVDSHLGCFSELEYHVPAIGGSTGLSSCDATSQVWAFRGEKAKIRQVAAKILGHETALQ
jgi:hypothetical protein